MKNLLLGMTAAAAAFLTTPAKAETINCTEIASIPTIITAQGVYCFTSDLSSPLTSGNMIDIQTNNVTIDLNGFKLGGLGAGAGTNAVGIVATERQNITIRNGSVRGFFSGILLVGATASGHLVEDVLLDTNRVVGIEVQGSGNVIRNNRVVNTGAGDISAAAWGIVAAGDNTVVAGNIVTGTSETAFSRGISVEFATLIEVRNNTVLATKDATATFGIQILSGTDITIMDNRILNSVPGSQGITAASSSGINCIHNTVANFVVTAFGCDFAIDNITPP